MFLQHWGARKQISREAEAARHEAPAPIAPEAEPAAAVDASSTAGPMKQGAGLRPRVHTYPSRSLSYCSAFWTALYRSQ